MWLAEACKREAWEIAAWQTAWLLNCHRDPKKPPIQPYQINPYAEKPRPVVVPISLLKDVFIDSEWAKGQKRGDSEKPPGKGETVACEVSSE